MTPEEWRRAKEVLAEALERVPAERAEFVRTACAGDNALQREVESLLAEDTQGDFLATKPVSGEECQQEETLGKSIDSDGRTLPPTIGGYRIIDFVGEGGMAVVYRAEQQQPRRLVALKVIKPALAGGGYKQRFEREKDALARLQHPGIARIYDAGTADTGSGPQPYFAMELIAHGQPLTAYAEAKKLNFRQRVELMAQVCDAVQHAHQNFIIHRDLKPRNILVDENGQPKVLDFGVARIADSDTGATRQTDIGQIIGTLDYMSPEQALGDPNELDTRSDIYALGIILYELLTGKRPYDLHNKAQLEALRVIREQDPVHLGSINGKYRGDIETIVAKCLEKDKARRYSSAAELATDIRLYLRDAPIMARPASARYQLHKFAKRNIAVVAGIVAVFVMLIVSAVISFVWFVGTVHRIEAECVQEMLRLSQVAMLRTAEIWLESGGARESGSPLTVSSSLPNQLHQLYVPSYFVAEIEVCDTNGHVLVSSESGHSVGSTCSDGPSITAISEVGAVQLLLRRSHWHDYVVSIPMGAREQPETRFTVRTIASGALTRSFIQGEILPSEIMLILSVIPAVLVTIMSLWVLGRLRHNRILADQEFQSRVSGKKRTLVVWGTVTAIALLIGTVSGLWQKPFLVQPEPKKVGATSETAGAIPQPVLSPVAQLFSPAELREYILELDNKKDRVQKALDIFARTPLSEEQKRQVEHIRGYLAKASEADVVEAVDLMNRADVLAKDLLDQLR